MRDPVKHLMPGPIRRRIAQDKVRSTVTLIGLVAFLPRTEANSPSARFASAEPLDLQQQEGKGVLSGQERFLRRSLSRSLRLPRRLSAFPGEQRHPPRTLTTYRPTAPTVRRPGALSGRATGGLCTPTRAGRDCDARPPAQRHQRAARSCCCCAPVVRALSPGPAAARATPLPQSVIARAVASSAGHRNGGRTRRHQDRNQRVLASAVHDFRTPGHSGQPGRSAQAGQIQHASHSRHRQVR